MKDLNDENISIRALELFQEEKPAPEKAISYCLSALLNDDTVCQDDCVVENLTYKEVFWALHVGLVAVATLRGQHRPIKQGMN